MWKIIQPWGWSGTPHELFDVIDPYAVKHKEFRKMAKARSVHPDIDAFVERELPAMKSSRYIYVLTSNMGADETWGCFPPNTPILMEDGTEKPIQSVVIGDRVRTHLGRCRPVTKTFRRENKDPLVQVGLWGNPRELCATPNHPVLCRRRGESAISWLPIRDVVVGDYLVEPLFRNDQPETHLLLRSFFKNTQRTTKGVAQTLVSETWEGVSARQSLFTLLGYYAAEGCIYQRTSDRGRRNKNLAGVIFVVSSHQPERESILFHAKRLGLRALETKSENGNATRIQITSAALARFCVFMCGHLASKKRLHVSMFGLEQDEKKWFLLAYVDGDGCIAKDGRGAGSVRASSASLPLVRDVGYMLASLGVYSSTHTSNQNSSSLGGGNQIHQLTVPASRSEMFIRGVSRFSGVRVPEDMSKSTRGFVEDAKIFRKVREITHGDIPAEVFNLEVEEDNSYVASSYAVHNSNVNADAFSRKSLSYKGSDWGIETFKTAGIFKDHKNTDKTKSYGDIVFVTFASAENGYMDRVESVVRLDREKAVKVGASDVIHSIENGNYPAWSMGCRVSYDVCSFCGNQAPNRAAYCVHMKRYPNAVLTETFRGKPGFESMKDDHLGLRIRVFNPKPKFFDFSKVVIGAAAEAKTLQKLASQHHLLLSSDLAEIVYGDVMKLAEEKQSAIRKRSEIDKRIEPQQDAPIGTTLKLLSDHEPRLEEPLLKALESAPFAQGLSSLAGCGMMLKPPEFQRLALGGLGFPSLGKELWDNNLCFDPQMHCNPEPCPPIRMDLFLRGLAQLFLSLVPQRSVFHPPLVKRMMVIRIRPSSEGKSKDALGDFHGGKDIVSSVLKSIVGEEKTSSVRFLNHPTMTKIAGMYQFYKYALAEFLHDNGMQMLSLYPEIRNAVCSSLPLAFSKEASPLLSALTFQYIQSV